ncbi:MAG: HAMP domain-containing histidine kinase [Tannerellaceae bacterium]|jgi:signal transduction histidine kinase|nr:HAMP domain-containing histidine kinase [Tannerellaceae bacterium]
MPDFNIKDIEKLRWRLQLAEKSFIVCVVLVVAAFYYDWNAVRLSGILLLAILQLIKIWLNRQLKQKEYLAKIVEERTIELRVQRDQVLLESEKLSKALDALARAQDELVRSERLATVGQLTKGLVDRILNPLNYINNFASLSVELAGDLEKNLRNGASALTEETCADTVEIVEMIAGNLRKITEHGANTVRIVKAMEELLKDQKGKMASADINNLCKVNMDVIARLFAKEIEEKRIKLSFRGLALSLMIDVNIEQMSKALLNILKNSMYAVLRKAEKQTFSPEISVNLQKEGSHIVITVCDNGVGIEESIKKKIFEPFFTTKPTAEASGIGLYVSREVILNHRGSIEVKTEQNQYTEFILKIPIHQTIETNEQPGNAD